MNKNRYINSLGIYPNNFTSKQYDALFNNIKKPIFINFSLELSRVIQPGNVFSRPSKVNIQQARI